MSNPRYTRDKIWLAFAVAVRAEDRGGKAGAVNALINALGLEIEPELPPRLAVELCGLGNHNPAYYEPFNWHLAPPDSAPWGSPEAKVAAYREAARCYAAVREALEHLKNFPPYPDSEVECILREGGR
jgi:hypothetical protein